MHLKLATVLSKAAAEVRHLLQYDLTFTTYLVQRTAQLLNLQKSCQKLPWLNHFWFIMATIAIASIACISIISIDKSMQHNSTALGYSRQDPIQLRITIQSVV